MCDDQLRPWFKPTGPQEKRPDEWVIKHLLRESVGTVVKGFSNQRIYAVGWFGEFPVSYITRQMSPLAAYRYQKSYFSYCVKYLFIYSGLDHSRHVKYRNGLGLNGGPIVPRGICALDWRLDLCTRPLDLILVWCHHGNPEEVLFFY